jgi:hypothetical protein
LRLSSTILTVDQCLFENNVAQNAGALILC